MTALFVLALWAAGPVLRFAEATSLVDQLEEYLAKLTALQAARLFAMALEFALKSPEDDIKTAVAAILAEAVARDELVKSEYTDDHKVLADIVWKDVTAEVTAIYAALQAVDSLSSNPGYRTPQGGQAIRFSEIYKNRVGDWQTYVLAAIAANKTQADDATSIQTTIKSLHDASLAAKGYRQLIQSRHQTANFMNQEMSKLRTDIQRQIDAETRIALNERQERMDWQAAFEQAVGTWTSQDQGKGY